MFLICFLSGPVHCDLSRARLGAFLFPAEPSDPAPATFRGVFVPGLAFTDPVPATFRAVLVPGRASRPIQATFRAVYVPVS